MKRILIAALVAIPAVGISYWAIACPCDRTPGLYLRGVEARAPVTDWSFANQVPLCQIQVDTGLLPHALNLNCWATRTGDLYLKSRAVRTGTGGARPVQPAGGRFVSFSASHSFARAS
jgi:hypothetical protein